MEFLLKNARHQGCCGHISPLLVWCPIDIVLAFLSLLSPRGRLSLPALVQLTIISRLSFFCFVPLNSLGYAYFYSCDKCLYADVFVVSITTTVWMVSAEVL